MDRRGFLRRMASTLMAAPLAARALLDAPKAEAVDAFGYPPLPVNVPSENVLDLADDKWDEEDWGASDAEPTTFVGKTLRRTLANEDFDWDKPISMRLVTSDYIPPAAQTWEATYYPTDRRTLFTHTVTLDGQPAGMPPQEDRLLGAWWRYPVTVDPADLNTITLRQPISLRLHPDAHVVITLHTDKGDVPLVARLVD